MRGAVARAANQLSSALRSAGLAVCSYGDERATVLEVTLTNGDGRIMVWVDSGDDGPRYRWVIASGPRSLIHNVTTDEPNLTARHLAALFRT
jgi:hypothetical protein